MFREYKVLNVSRDFPPLELFLDYVNSHFSAKKNILISLISPSQKNDGDSVDEWEILEEDSEQFEEYSF